ncbi:acyltransferase [Rhodopseudomonas sp. P2A-2r]|uniref:acyltransferase family protein n=1 Tax=Rhodopseudomonas sp. P2A-2r TaxID=2991972 RepID=UPI0022343DAD|nr:acyltransferase [Rhodopseudomonas sp. P2A-2r]UZE48180.1 acyltransferase [Rhodopseudomonas sp. P2A-2r]
MQTLGSALDDQKGFGRGFDFLRICLATGIIAWHTAQLSGHLELARASVFWLSEYMLVPMFFALSGFLVAGSSTRLSAKNFMLNRAARILPALIVDIFFAALLIGPLVTTLPAREYFTDATFFSYFLNITGWIHYSLPGVFENNPSPEVNGALWTVPFEMGCYVILIGLMLSGAIKRTRVVPLFTLGVLIAGIYLRQMSSHLVSDHASFFDLLAMNLFLFRGSLLWPSFLIGIVLYQLRYCVPFSRTAAIGLLCVAALLSAFGSNAALFGNPGVHAIALPLLGYLTVLVGLSPMPRLPGFGTGDYSYGLYLYHVPFLQLLIHYFPEAWTGDRWWTLFLVGFPLSLTAAVISWHLFEYPVLKLRNSFVIKRRPEGATAVLGVPRLPPTASLPLTAHLSRDS